jgi:hypothetical protein
MGNAWNRYWFSPAPCFDLAVVRIIACIGALYYAWIFRDYHSVIDGLASLPDQSYKPLFVFRLLNLPFGWSFGSDAAWPGRPGGEFVSSVFTVCVVAGILATVGALTRVSLAVFSMTLCYTTAYIYSFGDFHHPAPVMIIALAAMALSPAGRVLSVDSLLGRGPRVDVLSAMDRFAGWPIKFVMWFFALMYWSAVFSKLSRSGLDWANGFTLQWYLARNAMEKDGAIGFWLSHHHDFIMLTQIAVLFFQATFFVCILFPKLRWIYAPVGLLFHIGIYVTLGAHFFTWIALYSIFVPWSELVIRLRGTRSFAAAT